MSKQARGTLKLYSSKEICARLQTDLPQWYFENGMINRKYTTASWKGALMVVNAIAHLAEAAWHHPDLEVSFSNVVVKLMTHKANGVTDKDFELAAKIEQLVLWQPGKDDTSTLAGTPDNEKHLYIIY